MNILDNHLMNNEISISLRMFGVENTKTAEVLDLVKWEQYTKEEKKEILIKQFEIIFETVSTWLDEDVI